MADLNATSVVIEAATDRLPLSVALRAAASELPESRGRELWALSERLDAGEPVDAALTTAAGPAPPYLTELIRGASRTPQGGRILSEYIDQTRRSSDRRRRMRIDLTAPTLMIVATFGLMLFLIAWIVPQFQRVFEDFGTQLPSLTGALIDLSDMVVRHKYVWLTLLVLAVAGLVALAIGVRSSSNVRSILWEVPLIGPAMRYSALADFSQFLSLFAEFRTPLADAVRFAAGASGDPVLIDKSRIVVAELEAGVAPVDAVSATRAFPEPLTHAFRYASDPKSFAATLQAQASVFNSLAESNSLAVPLIIGPVVVIGAAGFALLTAVALYAPLIKLLNDLS